MFYRQNLRFLLLVFCLLFIIYPVQAQNVFSNATTAPGSSDNTGGGHQLGSEVLNSSFGMGVIFEAGSTYEHVGQFYVAEDGIWNHSQNNAGSTDYFGYAPRALGSYIPYQGVGIKGASANNGGRGAGRPSFSTIELNSTGVFPVVAGMYIASSLVFNANGPGRSSIITTPNVTRPDLPVNAVVFSPIATITGMNDKNYIDGFASVTGVSDAFTLPLGDPADTANPLHTLTIISAPNATITARYLHTVQRSITAFGPGISWVSPIGNWPISTPEGTSVMVSMPVLNLSADEATYLRLVGWNGRQWIDLSGTSTPGACVTGNCPLIGKLTANITDLAIGLSRNPANLASLTVWPNPTRGDLHLTMPADKTIDWIQILDQQGRPVLSPSRTAFQSGLNVSSLPSDSYILEVYTTEGHIFRQRFIRQ